MLKIFTVKDLDRIADAEDQMTAFRELLEKRKKETDIPALIGKKNVTLFRETMDSFDGQRKKTLEIINGEVQWYGAMMTTIDTGYETRKVLSKTIKAVIL